jgi:hypothetical protein
MLALAGGCTEAPRDPVERTPTQPSGEGGSPYSLDSALTLFRQGIPPLDTLENASSSIDDLVSRFAGIVEKRDTAALREIVMSRREYAWLYYPTSRWTKAPTKQEPGLNWFLHIQNSQKGATRLLREHGGRPLRITRNECLGPARIEGSNTIWGDCRQTIVTNGDSVVTRLFGGVIERAGRYKIFAYSNDL